MTDTLTTPPGPTALRLYAHPFSSYCQKALIALYEHGLAFDHQILAREHPEALAAWSAIWPLRRFPVLVDRGRVVPEATIIIEHLDLHHPGPVRLVPEDPRAALEVRLLDRLFDNYIMTPMQRIVFDAARPADERDPRGVSEARALLDTAYAWANRHLAGRSWAVEDQFSLADCAAAPALLYADWIHPIGAGYPELAAYRARLLRRPSFARAVEEARPYRSLFPLGDPGRD